MNFGTAVSTCLSKYVVFSGRARRSEYWFFFLFNFVIGIVVTVIDAVIGSPILGWLVTLAFLLPSIAAGIRRLHDTDRSGWWILIGLIPIIGTITLIVFNCQDSSVGSNQYGESPKEIGGGYGGYPQGPGYPPPPGGGYPPPPAY